MWSSVLNLSTDIVGVLPISILADWEPVHALTYLDYTGMQKRD